jgi:hypothetical protein
MSALHSHTGRSFRTLRPELGSAAGVQCSRCIGRCALHRCALRVCNVCVARLQRVRCAFATRALGVCNVCAARLQRVRWTFATCALRVCNVCVARLQRVRCAFATRALRCHVCVARCNVCIAFATCALRCHVAAPALADERLAHQLVEVRLCEDPRRHLSDPRRHLSSAPPRRRVAFARVSAALFGAVPQCD